MKSIIMFFALAIFSLTNINAQNPDFTVNTKNGLPQVTFKGKKDKQKKGKVVVSSGKMVVLKLTETISSTEVTIGQNIQLMVDINVIVDGTIVIKSNAYAIGRVKGLKESNSINCKSTLTLEVVSVQAIDGQQIPLNGQEQIFTSERPGQNVSLHAGKTITGFFKNDEVILIK